MNISELKGQKKIEAISALGQNPDNVELLLSLLETEKKDAKDAVLQALINFDTPVTLPLWDKMLKSKNKGEKILMYATSQIISDLVAEKFTAFLGKILQKSESLDEKQFREFTLFFSVSLGKSGEKMFDLFRFLAKNEDKICSLLEAKTIPYVGGKKLEINDFLRFNNPSEKQKKKIFPLLLTLSIIRNPDEKLLNLASELYQIYGDNWLIPKLMASLLTNPADKVYDEFSPFLYQKEKEYIVDTLAIIYFSGKENRHIAVAQWGNYEYGQMDSRTAFYAPLFENLSEKWFVDLTEIQPEPPLLQIYYSKGVGGVMFHSFEQMLADLVLNSFENQNIKQKLIGYFLQKEQDYNGQGTTYITILNYLGVPITEAMVRKWIDCRSNAVGEYNIPPVLNNCTAWSDEEKLNFYKKLPPKLQNKEEIKKLEMKISK